MNRFVHFQWRRTSISCTKALEAEALLPLLRLSDDRAGQARQWMEHAEPGDFYQPTYQDVVVCVKGKAE